MSNLNKNFKIFTNDIHWVDKLYENQKRVKSICGCQEKDSVTYPPDNQIPINSFDLLSNTSLSLNKGLYHITNGSLSTDIKVTINNITKDITTGDTFTFAIDDDNKIIELK
jgi:hypothetical protein